MAKTAEELRAIEVSFAYLAASSIIDSELLFAESQDLLDADDFLDVNSFRDDEEGDAERVEEAVAYLDSRGLIERHPSNPDWIQVRDESEPAGGGDVVAVGDGSSVRLYQESAAAANGPRVLLGDGRPVRLAIAEGAKIDGICHILGSPLIYLVLTSAATQGRDVLPAVPVNAHDAEKFGTTLLRWSAEIRAHTRLEFIDGGKAGA